jgi:hypothetical protein
LVIIIGVCLFGWLFSWLFVFCLVFLFFFVFFFVFFLFVCVLFWSYNQTVASNAMKQLYTRRSNIGLLGNTIDVMSGIQPTMWAIEFASFLSF